MFYPFLSLRGLHFFIYPAICFIHFIAPTPYFFAPPCRCLSYFFPSQPYISLPTRAHVYLCLSSHPPISLPAYVMFYPFLSLPGLHFFIYPAICFIHFIPPHQYVFASLHRCFSHFFPSQPYISFLPSTYFFASLGYVLAISFPALNDF